MSLQRLHGCIDAATFQRWNTEIEVDSMNFQTVKHAFKPVSATQLEALERASYPPQRELSIGLDEVGMMDIALAVKAKQEMLHTPEQRKVLTRD